MSVELQDIFVETDTNLIAVQIKAGDEYFEIELDNSEVFIKKIYNDALIQYENHLKEQIAVLKE